MTLLFSKCAREVKSPCQARLEFSATRNTYGASNRLSVGPDFRFWPKCELPDRLGMPGTAIVRSLGLDEKALVSLERSSMRAPGAPVYRRVFEYMQHAR